MPSSVSRSINNSGASVTRAALVPSAWVIGPSTGVSRVPRIVSFGICRLIASLMLRRSRDAVRACGMECKDVGDRTVQRSGHVYGFTQFDYSSRQPTHFKPIATFQIVVHGGGHVIGHVVRQREAMVCVIAV